MTRILLAILAGGLNTLAFAPFNYWPLGMLGFGILFSVWLVSTYRQAILIGFFFGLSMFGIGVSWMYISLNTYGGMPPGIAALSIFLGIAFTSLYPALCGWLQSLFRSWNVTLRLSVIMPSIWILVEWVRGWLFSGFPWLSTGYAYLDTPLSNFAPIGGVYLVGFIVLLSVGSLVAVLRHATMAISCFSLLLIGVWVTGWQLNETAWTAADGEPVSVAIIQNNVPLSQKWDEEETNATIARYVASSKELTEFDLIVWPEAAVADYLDNLSNNFWKDIEQHNADFVFGVLHRAKVGDSMQYYNSVAAVTDQIMIYRKQHLVPFGEYFPLQWLFGPLVRMLEIPMSDFTPWTSPQLPLYAADTQFAVSICFEDAFPNEVRAQIPAAGALINVSEDIWFGDSFAPHQRLQMARFRSRETERPMIRSSNNGLSSLINWKGGVDKYAPQFVEFVVKGNIQPRTGITPYTAFGDSPVLSLAGLLLLAGIMFGRLRIFRTK